MLLRAQDPKLLTPQILRCRCCTWEFQRETGRERQQQTVVVMLLLSMTAAFFPHTDKTPKTNQKENRKKEDLTKLIHVIYFCKKKK
jgi:hypothetical protein